MATPYVFDGQVIGGSETETQYVLKQAIGKGSFGEVRLAERLSDGEIFAVKLQEMYDQNGTLTNSHLNTEYEVMKALERFPGFPRALMNGSLQRHYYLVMSRLGPSLHELHERYSKRFTLKTVLCLASRALRILESIHGRGYVHSDIKPENFLMGHGTDSNVLYIVDFGLSLRWLTTNGRHIKYRDGKIGITGTLRYCSLNTHAGIELSRRDDLESLIYTMIYLLKGNLPWQGQTGTKEEKRKRVFEIKQKTLPRDLCQEFPQAFTQLLEYVRTLKFDSNPDYGYCRDLIERSLSVIGAQDDGCFEWSGPNGAQATNRSKRPNEATPEYLPPTKRFCYIAQDEINKAQWIVTVTRCHDGQTQNYARELDYNQLVEWLKANGWGSDHGLYITSLVHSLEPDGSTMWNCILSSNTNYTSQQIKKCSSPISAEAWAKKKRQEQYQVTCISGHVQNSCVVVVVSRTEEPPPPQAMTFCEFFPRCWIESQWKLGYFITSLGVAGVYWLVVMSRDSNTYSRQWFQTSLAFPAQAIKDRWGTGFRVTAMASKEKVFALVMSQLVARATSQGYNCSPVWPMQYITDAKAQNRYVSGIAWKMDG
eukprot:TRINITY_DN10777_c0_g1_i1.p1 TRINITY_DN10777_c0_g1~~TRINITY_DN10777_c0_g1_i1.p1  ORF type:complete len:595 (-),score=116.48 TRINITY_DN10777_c0_g1_i1:776-2560(-)